MSLNAILFHRNKARYGTVPQPRILVLDDSKDRHHLFGKIIKRRYGIGYDAVWTEKEAIRALRSGRYHYVFLDHDLGYTDKEGGSGTGVVNWITKHTSKFKKLGTRFIIHSANDEEGPRMMVTLENAGLPVKREKFFINIFMP